MVVLSVRLSTSHLSLAYMHLAKVEDEKTLFETLEMSLPSSKW
jgi:hypothetical protein